MTDQQKQAINILNKLKVQPTMNGEAMMTDDEYFLLLDFIIGNKTEIPYVPQPAIPWTVPQPLDPYYGRTNDPVFAPPYRVTCEFIKE